MNREITRHEALANLANTLTQLNQSPMERSLLEQLFLLNNYFYPHIIENFSGCGSCINRVTTRMQEFWNNTGKNELDNGEQQ